VSVDQNGVNRHGQRLVRSSQIQETLRVLTAQPLNPTIKRCRDRAKGGSPTTYQPSLCHTDAVMIPGARTKENTHVADQPFHAITRRHHVDEVLRRAGAGTNERRGVGPADQSSQQRRPVCSTPQLYISKNKNGLMMIINRMMAGMMAGMDADGDDDNKHYNGRISGGTYYLVCAVQRL
jgi:hypothetical protein